MTFTADDVTEQIYQSDDLSHVTGFDAATEAHAAEITDWDRSQPGSLVITLDNGQRFKITAEEVPS